MTGVNITNGAPLCQTGTLKTANAAQDNKEMRWEDDLKLTAGTIGEG